MMEISVARAMLDRMERAARAWSTGDAAGVEAALERQPGMARYPEKIERATQKAMDNVWGRDLVTESARPAIDKAITAYLRTAVDEARRELERAERALYRPMGPVPA